MLKTATNLLRDWLVQRSRKISHTRTDMSEPVPFFPLATEAQFTEALARSAHEPVVVFKHSNSCGISRAARRRVQALTLPGDPPVYEVVVQEARPLSNDIAARLEVRHQSPQAIVLYRAQPVFHMSHGRVTAQAIREAAAQALTEEPLEKTP